MPYDNNGGDYEVLNNLFAYDGDGETRMAQYRMPGRMYDYDRMPHDFDRRDFDRYDWEHHIHHHHHHHHHFDRDFFDFFPFLFFI